MILNTKEDFEKAVLKGEEIKHKAVFYTGELDKQSEPIWAIGSYDTKLGIYAGKSKVNINDLFEVKSD